MHVYHYPGFKNQFIAKTLLFLKTWISKGLNRDFEKFQKIVIFCQELVFHRKIRRGKFTNHNSRFGLVNQGKRKVNEQKCLSAVLCAEHFYFQDRHLFSCVDPLLLCYRVLNMGRVPIKSCFDVFWSFLSL